MHDKETRHPDAAYSDIRQHPRCRLRSHRPMPESARAAQFSAFAALTGFDEEIGEAARLTTVRTDMAEDGLAALDAAFQQLVNGDTPVVTVVYFQPDAKKSGGAYTAFTGEFRHYDAETGMLRFAGDVLIPAAAICKIIPQRTPKAK